MVLDDESDIVALFRKSLELAGFGVFAFTEPLSALEHLRQNADRYGLIISDVRMPKMDGIEFAMEARKVSPSLKIILMSAYNMSGMEFPSELIIDELMEKPVSQTKLKAIVSKYVNPIPADALLGLRALT